MDTRLTLFVVVLYLLLCLALPVFVVYAALHFVIKYW